MHTITTRFSAVALLGLFAATPAFAQGPIATSAAAQTARATQTATAVRTERRSTELFVTGLALEFMGGFMLGDGLRMQHEVTCLNLGAFVSCQETGAEKGLFIGLGAAGIAGGYALATWGKRVTVAPMRNGILGRVRF